MGEPGCGCSEPERLDGSGLRGGQSVPAIVTSMSCFTSDRERRLWFWALAVVVAIYSTVGLAGKLAEVLRDRGLLDASFALAFLLVIGAIAGSALKRRPGRREIWVAIGITAVFGMVVVRMGIGLAALMAVTASLVLARSQRWGISRG